MARAGAAPHMPPRPSRALYLGSMVVPLLLPHGRAAAAQLGDQGGLREPLLGAEGRLWVAPWELPPVA